MRGARAARTAARASEQALVEQVRINDENERRALRAASAMLGAPGLRFLPAASATVTCSTGWRIIVARLCKLCLFSK